MRVGVGERAGGGVWLLGGVAGRSSGVGGTGRG